MTLRILVAVCAFLTSFNLQAQNAWQIKVTLKPFTSGYLFLAHHYGSKQMLVDSAAIDKNSQAVFQGKEKLAGGIYMIVFPKKDGWVEVIIDKEQHFSLTADSADIVKSMTIAGSNDNQLFKDYLLYSQNYGVEMNELQNSTLATPELIRPTGKHSCRPIKRTEKLPHKFINDPQHLLSSIFKVFRNQ
jgi:hypothetical protein